MYQLVRVYTILFYIYCAQFLCYHSLHLFFFLFLLLSVFCLLILVLFPFFSLFHWGGVDWYIFLVLLHPQRRRLDLLQAVQRFSRVNKRHFPDLVSGMYSRVRTRSSPDQELHTTTTVITSQDVVVTVLPGATLSEGKMLLDWAGALDATPPKLESCWASDNEALQGQWSPWSEIQNELAVPFPTQLRTRTLVSFQWHDCARLHPSACPLDAQQYTDPKNGWRVHFGHVPLNNGWH